MESMLPQQKKKKNLILVSSKSTLLGNFKKIVTIYKIILKNSHSFKKFKN